MSKNSVRWLWQLNAYFIHAQREKKNDLNKYKEHGIKKIISCSKDKGDNIHVKLENILNCADQESMIWSHNSCYCSYTSTSRNTPVKTKKRKSSCPPPGERLLKSQVPEFSREDFKTKCFLCAKVCEPRNPKNPKIWRQWSCWSHSADWRIAIRLLANFLFCIIESLFLLPGSLRMLTRVFDALVVNFKQFQALLNHLFVITRESRF